MRRSNGFAVIFRKGWDLEQSRLNNPDGVSDVEKITVLSPAHVYLR